MPIIKSAKKRVRVAKKATIRNRRTKRSLRIALKSFQTSLSGSKKQAEAAANKSQSSLDKAVKKGVMHKNKAARKKRQLATAMSKAHPHQAAKPAAKKSSVKKPTTTKKPATKKTTAKKSTPTAKSKK